MKRQVFFLVVLVLIGWFCVYAYNVKAAIGEKEAVTKYEAVVKERDVLKRAYLFTSKNDDKKEILGHVMKGFSFTSRENLAQILMIKEQVVVEENNPETTEQK